MSGSEEDTGCDQLTRRVPGARGRVPGTYLYPSVLADAVDEKNAFLHLSKMVLICCLIISIFDVESYMTIIPSLVDLFEYFRRIYVLGTSNFILKVF